MRRIAAAIKKYWWEVLKALIGAYLLISSVNSLITVIIMKSASSYEPELERAVASWFWILLSFFAWTLGGTALMHSGTSQIVKKRRAGAERGS